MNSRCEGVYIPWVGQLAPELMYETPSAWRHWPLEGIKVALLGTWDRRRCAWLITLGKWRYRGEGVQGAYLAQDMLGHPLPLLLPTHPLSHLPASTLSHPPHLCLSSI